MPDTYFTISIDVEPDCTPNWQYSDPLSFNGVKVGIKEILQPLFNKHHIKPTYLINNVVLEDDESIQIFKQLDGEFELGTHLHPEFIEPQKSYSNYAGQKGEANCCFYPEEIEFQKIKNITDLFKSKFGYQPLSFRAGRFSAGNNTIQSLIKLGYKIDTSVTPNVCWSDKTRQLPVDFRDAPEQPYFVAEDIRQQSKSPSLLQVPVSIARLNSNLMSELVKSGLGLRRNLRKYKPQWLRPAYSDFSQMKNVIEYYKSKYKANNVVILNMMFHNVEVLPNLSPYTRNENDVEHYIQAMENVFLYCKKENILASTLSEVYELYR